MMVLRWVAISLGLHIIGSAALLKLVEVDNLNPLHHARAAAQRLALTAAALLLLLGGTNA